MAIDTTSRLQMNGVDSDTLKKGFECLAGAYGPQKTVPLVSDLVGTSLLDMVAIAFSKLGSPSGILQNNGTMFPLEKLVSLFKPYCQEIRSTEEGRIRCLASDCQAVMIFAGGNHARLEPKLADCITMFPVEEVKKFGFPRDGTRCYRCHAGLIELVRAICVDSRTGTPLPIGTIWAGQNKVKDYSLRRKQVLQIAQDIGYPDPRRLAYLYEHIKATGRDKLIERAEGLAETGRAIEDSATASFHTKMQARFDKLTTSVLGHVQSSLSSVAASSTRTMQAQVVVTMVEALKEVVANVPGSCSALCEIGSAPSEGPKRGVRVRATESAQDTGEPVGSVVTVNAEQDELDQLLRRATATRPIVLSSGDAGCAFLTKIRSALKLDERGVMLIASIPTAEGGILWIQLLPENCEVVVGGNLLPDFLRMAQEMLDGIARIIETAYLTAGQAQTVQALRDRTNELSQKDAENRRLFQAIAHQVAAPIMGLKQAAYILQQGFSRDAYYSFRACLAEYERACWNFRIYDALTSEAAADAFNFRTSTSFDVLEVVQKARARAIPFADTKGRKIEVDTCLQKGRTLRHVTGNPNALVECLVNVMHNAVKYSLGSYPIEVTVSQESRFSVGIRTTNHGIELPEDDFERVFEERVRCETAKAVHIDGSGIGLFICRNLLRIHDATIRVESCCPTGQLQNRKTVWKTTFLLLMQC